MYRRALKNGIRLHVERVTLKGSIEGLYGYLSGFRGLHILIHQVLCFVGLYCLQT